MVGSPDTVAGRIAETMRTLRADRFTLKHSSGHMPPRAEHVLALARSQGRRVAQLADARVPAEPALV